MDHPQNWISEVKARILANLPNPNLTNLKLAKELAVSERLFYQKIKEITGQTPNQYIRAIRLDQAKLLLETATDITVKEVAARVGYTKVVYFSDLFKTKFGLYPSDILDQKIKK